VIGDGEMMQLRTSCRGCHGGCGVIAYVEDGRVTQVEGDSEAPIGRGTMCSKGVAVLQLAYHPDRVLYPMEKTDSGWSRISWDRALDTIAERFDDAIQEHGVESIVVGQGTGRDYESFLYRFANLLGTPNVLTAGHMCYVSRIGATLITCGNLPVSDFEGKPRCLVVWANNPLWTNPDEYKGVDFWDAYEGSSKLIVIDPREGFLAKRADLWLQLRPGTDAALALGFLKVIIDEELYDKEFVDRYVNGWEAFVERVGDYPLEKVTEITWVDRDLIREAARLYATTKPACIQWGVPIEQTINCTDSNRLLTALMAVTGNLDAPGGNVFFVPPPVRTVSEFALHRELPAEQRAKRLGGDQYKLASRVALVTPKVVWDAILTGEPYPVVAGLLCGTNPVVTRANAKEVREALSKLDFLAVIDFFPTPTAELADIILPAATWLEQDYVGDFWKRHGYVMARQKVVEIGECWQDHKIFQELGKRMGQGEYWWDTLEDALNYMLEPSGMDFREFVKRGYLKGKMRYRKYQEKGFSTPTGKVELYSTVLEKWGYDPLPQYREIPESPVSRPDLLKQYPYILNAGLRTPVFFHSEHRAIPWLREIRPDPLMEIHPDTAKRHGIEEGQWAYIESPRGRIKQRVMLNQGLDPRVVVAEHGWWYPEAPAPGHGWDISNVNVLTDNDPAGFDPALGSTNLRVLLCNITPCEEE
jgi:anaerobic selenocysteine-containing dehydrogenase